MKILMCPSAIVPDLATEFFIVPVVHHHLVLVVERLDRNISYDWIWKFECEASFLILLCKFSR